ncbi:MAG: hypothetical protein HC908_02320 [Calothrix sp. SM1_7_51]|nr:hypothetical protein [Calothrix sp. SM1_7_51]
MFLTAAIYPDKVVKAENAATLLDSETWTGWDASKITSRKHLLEIF